MIEAMRVRFSLGRVVITANAQRVLPDQEVRLALQRHLLGDWGDCCAEDRLANEAALRSGERLLSVYHTACDVRFWIVTEADRSATTVLLPEDY